MNKYVPFPTDEVLRRHLTLPQREALLQFAERTPLTDAQLRILACWLTFMAQMSGRGYRPPTTPDGWVEIYELLRRIHPSFPEPDPPVDLFGNPVKAAEVKV